MALLRYLNRTHRASRVSASRRRHRCMIEPLESRTMLNAALTTAIAPVDVAAGAAPTAIDLSAHFNDSTVVGTAIEIQTNLGNIPLTLFDSQTPKTVANFEQYIDAGEYNGVIIHRSIPGFVIQGGGYTSDGNHITTFAPVQGEPGISNVAGTIAMALSTGPDSGTSEWFINLADNSSSLDGSSDGGPFTVFGKVIYNGMSVVNAIAALQTVNDSQTPPGPGVWTDLPVQNYSGSSTPTSVPPSNMVVTNTITVPALSYQVSSDNTALVSPGVTNGVLTLTYGSGTGIAHVTVTATDLGGNQVATTFAIGVGLTEVTVGKGAARLVRFVDPDGTASQVSLAGGGQATLTFVGTGLGQNTSKSGIATVTGTPQSVSIQTSGSTAGSKLIISGHGGNGLVNLADITTSSLGAVNGPTTVLGGNLAASGSLGSVTLDSAGGGTISATAVGKMTIKGSFTDNLTLGSIGVFAAGSIGGGTWNVGSAVSSLSAKSVSGWTATLVGLDRLSVAGTIDSSALNSMASINSIAVGSLTNSNVYAGVSLSGGAKLPVALGAFTAADTIASLHVARSFANSNVAAQALGKMSLGTVTLANGGTVFGVAAHTITNLSVSAGGKKLNLHKVTSEAQITAALAAAALAPQDFVIQVV